MYTCEGDKMKHKRYWGEMEEMWRTQMVLDGRKKNLISGDSKLYETIDRCESWKGHK